MLQSKKHFGELKPGKGAECQLQQNPAPSPGGASVHAPAQQAVGEGGKWVQRRGPLSNLSPRCQGPGAHQRALCSLMKAVLSPSSSSSSPSCQASEGSPL